MKDLLNYINSGNPETDKQIKEWINKRPDGFTLDYVRDDSRNGNPNTYKVIISKNWFYFSSIASLLNYENF